MRINSQNIEYWLLLLSFSIIGCYGLWLAYKKLKWQSYFYVILPHPTEAKIWMLSDNEGWFLPHVLFNKGIWLSDFETIKEAIQQKLGFSINILYYANYSLEKSKRQIHGIYVLEQQNQSEKLKEGSWIDIETLESLSLKLPEHKSAIEEYLTEVESENLPKLRPPWARSGWFSVASAWIEEQLSELNYQQLAPVEFIKSWGISCVLRVSTTAGNVYFKEASTLPLFCNEPVVTAELAKLFPAHLPTILGIDRQRHWMLLADFGQPIGRKASIKMRQDVYRLLAQIQMRSTEHIDRLLAIGCLDRRLHQLQAQIDPLLSDRNALSELSTVEIERLHKLTPDLKNLCSQLADYQIPQTLLHGDLHLGNVALCKDNYLFFDWTDSCISHPFFDLIDVFFYTNTKPFLQPLWRLRDKKLLQSLRNEYLTQWTSYESMERLLEAWKLAKPLCALHHAITYQYIVASLEPRAKQELSLALPRFLREIIKSF